MLKSRLTAVPVSPPAGSHNNFTTLKQKEARNRFAEPLEEDRPDIPEPPEERIAEEQQLTRVKQAHHESVSSPRRSMVRQNKIWEDIIHGQQLYHPNQLKIISEDYYNEAVAAKTTVFLTKMRDLLHSHHEQIQVKRRDIVETVLKSIRNQWGATRQQLIELVTAWTKEGEQRQVTHFLQVGETKVSGELFEISSKMEMKRQELEMYRVRVEQMRREQKVIDEDEIVERSYSIKRLLKEIWEKNYQCQIGELTEQSTRISLAINPADYSYSQFGIEVDRLHLQIDRMFISSKRIERKKEEKTESVKEVKNESPPEPLPSTPTKEELHQKRVLQSLMQGRVRELDAIRNQRQMEWKQLLQKTLRKGE